MAGNLAQESLPVGHAEHKQDDEVEYVRVDERRGGGIARRDIASEEEGDEQGAEEGEAQDSAV